MSIREIGCYGAYCRTFLHTIQAFVAAVKSDMKKVYET